MTRYERNVIAQREQLVAYAADEFIMVTQREISAADRPLE